MRRLTYLLVLIFGVIFVSSSQAFWFENANQAEGVVNDVSYTCSWGDFNNDGNQDIFVGTHFTPGRSHLYENINGIFTDVAGAKGVEFLDKSAFASCWGDYNNDGYLDLYVVAGTNGSANVLYHNLGPDGNYAFESVYGNVVGDMGPGRGAVWGDFDNDGLLDLYVVNGWGTILCKMFKNTGNGFIDQPCVPRDYNNAQGVAAGDIDNDGDLDIIVTNSTGGNKLYVNQLKETGAFWLFTEEAASLGSSIIRRGLQKRLFL